MIKPRPEKLAPITSFLVNDKVIAFPMVMGVRERGFIHNMWNTSTMMDANTSYPRGKTILEHEDALKHGDSQGNPFLMTSQHKNVNKLHALGYS